VALLQRQYRLSRSPDGSRSRRISRGKTPSYKATAGSRGLMCGSNKGLIAWIIGSHRPGHLAARWQRQVC
jgi:hypothetical protein